MRKVDEAYKLLAEARETNRTPASWVFGPGTRATILQETETLERVDVPHGEKSTFLSLPVEYNPRLDHGALELRTR